MLQKSILLLCVFLPALSGQARNLEHPAMGDCLPPEVNLTWTEDCDAGEFYIHLDVTALGDSPELTIEVDISGFVETFTNVGLGEVVSGPAYLGDIVNITVMHATDPDCNVVFTDLEPVSDCPFPLACGTPPVILNYCYQDNDQIAWTFQGLGSGSLLLNYLQGVVQAGDILTIHDGLDESAPILFQHDGTTDIDLTGISVASGGPQMYISLVADGSGSCGGIGLAEISWSIACLNCAFPQVVAQMVEDCETSTFTVDLDITSTGSGTAVDLEYTLNGGPTQVIPAIGIGPQMLGPFNVNDVVDVTLVHQLDGTCDLPLGVFTDSGMCPTLIECDQPALSENYCYTNNDSTFWYYELVGTEGSIHLEFTGGSIQSGTDELIIYDGADPSAPVLYEHEGNTPLSAISVISTSGSLFMVMTSNGNNSCDDGLQTQWQWNVSCVNCQPPIATFGIVQDCPNSQYFVEVDISVIGSDDQLLITNTLSAPEVTATAPGVQLIGPFATGTPVQLTLVNDDNSLCSVTSPVLVNPLCPLTLCGTSSIAQNYCYGPSEVTGWAYEVSAPGTIHLVFSQGTIQSSSFDQLRIYDGPDSSSPLLFEHDQTATSELGPDGYAVDVTTTGQNIYMELISNGSVQCSTSSSYDPWEWEVNCVGCQVPGTNYTLVPDCPHLGFAVEVEVIEVLGSLGLEITDEVNSETVLATGPGTFTFEMFDLDSAAHITINDLDNPGCVYESGPLVYTRDSCVVTSCGIDNYEVCYGNDDALWYTFRSESSSPVAISFLQGQMLPGDDIVIYNGLAGGMGQGVIYQGNNGGNLTGIQVASSNANNALTLRIRSNEQGSCADGAITVPIRWDVGCGAVGVEELPATQFSLFPDPGEGDLSVRFARSVSGPITIRVMDMSGREVHRSTRNADGTDLIELQLGDLQSGQYALQMVGAEWIAVRTFRILQR